MEVYRSADGTFRVLEVGNKYYPQYFDDYWKKWLPLVSRLTQQIISCDTLDEARTYEQGGRP